MNTSTRPFTEALRCLRRHGATYKKFEARSHNVRSYSWFRNLNESSDPWAVRPPSPETYSGLSALLGVSNQVLRQWVATEWYGAPGSDHSPEVIDLAQSIAALEEEDQKIVTDLTTRLCLPSFDSMLLEVAAAV